MLSSTTNSFTYLNAGVRRERFFCGSTISNDGHPGMKFDFCISNPPFGTPWKTDLQAWGLKDNEKQHITDPRFVLPHGYDPRNSLRFVPDVGDPQMLFLANNISRMKHDTELGTRIVEVHNGSSLFTGNAGAEAKATFGDTLLRTIGWKLSSLCPRKTSTTLALAPLYG